MADDTSVATFHWADYLVLGLFLAFNVLLGLVIGILDRKKATSKQFLMGGGDMHWIPVALSMQASFLSAITILSTPTEVYNFGTTYAYIGISYFIAIPLSGHMFLPTFYKLRLVSVYEYLERRFNRTVRTAGSLTFCVMVILYMSVVLYSPAIALAQVTGLAVNVSIALCGLVCTAYTVLGGMKATIWNDFCQMIVIFTGLIIIISLGAEEEGGMDNVWAVNEEGGRIVFNSFNPDPIIRTTFWTQTIGGSFVSLSMYASSQTIIQKFLSVKTLKNAQMSIWLASFTSLLTMILVTCTGLVLFAHFKDCDPLLSTPQKVEKSDQMVPLLVMEVMGHLHGLPGLFIATSFSAALSSVSGSVNALSAVALMDFIRPIYRHFKKDDITERTSAILSRCLALIFGLITTIMGFMARYLGDLVLQIALSIFGFVGGPLTALLALGLFFPFVNSWGALAGLLSSLGICSWIAIGAIIAKNPLPYLERSTDGCYADDYLNGTLITAYMTTSDVTYVSDELDDSGGSDILWVYKISHMYYGLIAMIIAFIVGIVVSLITGVAKGTDPRLTFQWGKECCCYCPLKCRNCLKCGAKEIEDDTECFDEEQEKEEIDNVGINNEFFMMSYNDKTNVNDDKIFNDTKTTFDNNNYVVAVANGSASYAANEKSAAQNGVVKSPSDQKGSQIDTTEFSQSDRKSPSDLKGGQEAEMIRTIEDYSNSEDFSTYF